MSAPTMAPPHEAVTVAEPSRKARGHRPRGFKKTVWRYRALYLMAVPGIVYFLVFKYLPMAGLVIAFQNYLPFLGVSGSEWVGFDHFVRFFTDDTFIVLLLSLDHGQTWVDGGWPGSEVRSFAIGEVR